MVCDPVYHGVGLFPEALWIVCGFKSFFGHGRNLVLQDTQAEEILKLSTTLKDTAIAMPGKQVKKSRPMIRAASVYLWTRLLPVKMVAFFFGNRFCDGFP